MPKISNILSSQPHVCTSCNATFQTLGKLEKHVEDHKRQFRYPCPRTTCPHGFKTKNAFTRHYNTHTGEKPHHCAYCDRPFADPSGCSRHQGTMHEPWKLFSCSTPGCTKRITRSDAYRTHLKRCAGREDVITQEECDAARKRSRDKYDALARARLVPERPQRGEKRRKQRLRAAQETSEATVTGTPENVAGSPAQTDQAPTSTVISSLPYPLAVPVPHPAPPAPVFQGLEAIVPADPQYQFTLDYSPSNTSFGSPTPIPKIPATWSDVHPHNELGAVDQRGLVAPYVPETDVGFFSRFEGIWNQGNYQSNNSPHLYEELYSQQPICLSQCANLRYQLASGGISTTTHHQPVYVPQVAHQTPTAGFQYPHTHYDGSGYRHDHLNLGNAYAGAHLADTQNMATNPSIFDEYAWSSMFPLREQSIY